MELTGCRLFSSYQQHVSSVRGGEELRTLAEQLTVCETYFFRYAPQLPRVRRGSRPQSRRREALTNGCAFFPRDAPPERRPTHSPSCFGSAAGPRGVGSRNSRHRRQRVVVGKARRAQLLVVVTARDPCRFGAEVFSLCGSRDFLLDGCGAVGVTFEERNLVEEDPLFWQRGTFTWYLPRCAMYFAANDVTRRVISRITPIPCARRLSVSGPRGDAPRSLAGISFAAHPRNLSTTGPRGCRETDGCW